MPDADRFLGFMLPVFFMLQLTSFSLPPSSFTNPPSRRYQSDRPLSTYNDIRRPCFSFPFHHFVTDRRHVEGISMAIRSILSAD